HHDVALVPSYFVDPEMACPATTYYRSVQVHGMLRDVDDLARKAAALAAFMAHQQPEGGHAPIRVEDPRYAKELRAVRVFGVEAERITGKESLGQDRPPERTQKVVEGLWRRGDPDDPRPRSRGHAPVAPATTGAGRARHHARRPRRARRSGTRCRGARTDVLASDRRGRRHPLVPPALALRGRGPRRPRRGGRRRAGARRHGLAREPARRVGRRGVPRPRARPRARPPRPRSPRIASLRADPARDEGPRRLLRALRLRALERTSRAHVDDAPHGALTHEGLVSRPWTFARGWRRPCFCTKLARPTCCS